MLYEYKTATGSVQIEEDEKWIAILEELDKEEASNNRKETRRHSTLDNDVDDAEWLAYEDEGLKQLLFENEGDTRVQKTLKQMKSAQREILIAIYSEGIKQEEYAAKLGITQGAVSQRLATAEKNFIKIFSKT